jgi:hypothetical protein
MGDILEFKRPKPLKGVPPSCLIEEPFPDDFPEELRSVVGIVIIPPVNLAEPITADMLLSASCRPFGPPELKVDGKVIGHVIKISIGPPEKEPA